MNTIKEIFQAFGDEYMDRFGDAMPGDHRKVVNAIINCRTNHYGATISIPVKHAAKPTSSIVRVATGTAPTASIIKPGNGWINS